MRVQVVLQTTNDEFQQTCEKGHLEVAQWFIEVFPETDPHNNEDEVFICACGYGCLNVATWLITTFPSTEPHTLDDYPLYLSFKNGHINVTRWILDNWGDTVLIEFINRYMQ
jgi:hypothetical protein